MKRFAQYVGIALLAGLFLVSVASANNCCPPPPPGPASADASAFVNTEITSDQLVFNQVNSEHGLMVNTTKTFDVSESGYGAYHNGPVNDGKGFYSNELGVKCSDTLKVACYSLDVHSQGMSQAMTTAGDAGAGAAAQGFAGAGASAGGVSGGVQAQGVTYAINGMNGGVQLMGTASYVNVDTQAGYGN